MLLFVGEQSDHRERHNRYASDAELQSLFPKVRIITLPGVGHMMHHEDPLALARHIVEFDQELAIGA
jgi:pimeloyl-ACP methyl ester carboxylesterase